MNHLLAKSVMRRLITGRSSIISASPASSLTIFRPLTEPAMVTRECFVCISGGGHELMKRMMSSEAMKELPEKNKEVSGDVTTAEEKKKKQGGGDGEVVVSSYWGVARPRITKEDGTEWPWNCFMVSTCSTVFIISLCNFYNMMQFAYYCVYGGGGGGDGVLL